MAKARGRPTKFTPERREKIIQLIKAGNYLETATQAAGIDYSTFRNWMNRGEDALQRQSDGDKLTKVEKEFVDFVEHIQKAEAEAEARNLMIINKAASDSWQAAAWYLERKHHDRWGRKDRVQADVNHSGEVKNDVSLSLQSLSVEELRRLANPDK